ncbi:sigma-70 family RNA polymerase sigma factor [Microlunatus flavus]|uniref:RNA polymerase sigma-70 factor, ECF subfamily n=1 Tax=Microlunatus flavus TaxID=1036181 RepID=A0A1H9IAD2_9ACTN|nr:sigma-70 family RNA polymerase sigma factor [Microlunatus flavus]SEQ71671.1 RNA polymerase sigma-70 factor, ECF subfamily [Microlunatus flavus]
MGARSVEDSSAVVDALRGGGADGLSAVYDRWSPLVYSLALRALGDVTRAEDVTKQVFTELWTGRGSVEPGHASFSAWLIELACARIEDARAATGAVPGASTEAGRAEGSGEGRSRPVVLAERLVLADGLSHLDPVPQRVLRMILDDLTPAEVAARTGLSVEDVKSQVASSLIQLRQRWEVPTDAH